MATSFPGGYDSFTNPTSGDALTSPSHADQHANVNDAIEAMQPKIGQQGTAFPASPSVGDRYYRTDLREWCFYDGTRWLGELRTVSGNVSGTTTSGATVVDAIGARSGHDIYIERAAFNSLTLTTNNGSNYWTLSVVDLDSGGALGSTHASQSLSADGTSTYAGHELTVGAVSAYASRRRVALRATKTGSPGALYSFGVIEYRLIHT